MAMERHEPKEASAFTKYRLLMWKNFLQQWRHRGQTLIELILPIATMALVLILRSQIEPENRDVINFPPVPAHTLNYSLAVIGGMNLTELSLAYSPESPVLDDVLKTSVARLLVRNVVDLLPLLENITDIEFPEIPPDIDLETPFIIELIKSLINLDAYSSGADLRGVYAEEATTRTVLAAVEFDDDLYRATELSSNLSFSLRFPERPRFYAFYSTGGRSWRTDVVFPLFGTPGPRSNTPHGGGDPGYVREMFIALQHMISSELISRYTGEDINRFTVNLQRYPHPSYLEDMALETLQLMFPMFLMFSFSYTAVNIVRALTVEKELQLKETMKIMGLPTWLHWTAWFCKQFVYLLIMAVFIVVLIKVNWFTNEEGFSDYAVLTNTPWTVIFFFLLLYLTCTIFFCFMMSGFFSKGSTAALFTGVIWFLNYIPAFLLAVDVAMSTSVQIITCLFINSAMAYGMQLLVARESTGGMRWGDFFSRPSTESSRFTFGHVVVMLLVDCVLYMLLALYLEQVLPGPYGTPKPWYFPLQKHFWFPRSKDISVPQEIIETEQNNDVTKEPDPTDLSIGVKMTNLTKVYGENVAVNKLCMNIYDDQITVLLGHNGAGKSTTISMLTGNVEVTCGAVLVAGYDVSKQTQAARAHLGLCPQHNVLFNELTVREHLEFFARLKGFKGEQLNNEINSIIDKLELQEKRDYQAHGLSGGQKRRLCVGIALSGGARVVLLDEPTSGMDPASRRALWELLQKEKKGRSMILTTHFMDEADILGDRVAIMANGRLQCVGSPYFLKQHYGVGYTLVIVKNPGFQYEVCTELINKYIPGTTIKEDRGTEVTYNLTNEHSHVFEKMLKSLEDNIEQVKFKNYGLLATTLEDVFMSVGSDVPIVTASDSMDDTATVTDTSTDEIMKLESLEQLNEEGSKLVGAALWWQHAWAVWLKLWLVWSRSWALVLLQVLTPLLIINATLGIIQYMSTFIEEVRSRPLDLTQGYTRTETLLSYNGTSPISFGALAKAGYEMIFNLSDISTMSLTVVDGQTVDEYYLEQGADPYRLNEMRHSVLTGATFADEGVTAWFSNFGYHDVATTLAAVHAALLKAFRPEAEINVNNHPLEVNYADNMNMQMMLSMITMQLALGIGNSLGIVTSVYIMFYIKERVSRAKLLQKAAGVSPVVLWGSAAIFDWIWFNIISITIVISCAAFNVAGLSTAIEFARLYVCIMVYGAAMLPLTYLMSHVFKGPALGFVVMFFVNSLLGIVGGMIVESLWSPFLDTAHVADILDSVFQFFPLYSFITAVKELNKIGLTELTCLQSCEQLVGMMPGITECTMQTMCEVNPQVCCVRDNAYFDWEEPGILRYLVVMVFTCAFLWLVLLIIEYKLIQRILNREKKPPPVDETSLDVDVVDEMRHVQRADKGLVEGSSLVASGLSKYYGKHLAVDQVSFSVSEAECFGLLGVNGAGKTTTFKMLMGDETVSSGDAYIGGYSVKTNINKVHENIGYCPQFDAVFETLTGRENIVVFALMRGMRRAAADHSAQILAHTLGFTKHLDKRVEQYSGGNKRKLSTAIALLGHTRLVFVDEPTTGVDPAAKRQVWRAMRGARRAGRGVVLTSHSMEECEALCSRLTIMVNGRFQCLGTPQHLKNKYSQGFTLTIKMKIEDDNITHTSRENHMDSIKDYVNSNFTNPRLMEEYQGLLTYYLPQRDMPWSRMFGIMEQAKQILQIEDYSISQTTLEQIFLQFTKYQR